MPTSDQQRHPWKDPPPLPPTTPSPTLRPKQPLCTATGCKADAEYAISIITHLAPQPGFALSTLHACRNHAPAILIKFAVAIDIRQPPSTKHRADENLP